MRISHWMIVLGLVAALLPWVPLDWIPNIKPGPNPPGPTPTPVPVGPVSMLIVHEEGDRGTLTPSQLEIFAPSTRLLDWFDRHPGAKWRIFDQHADLTFVDPVWKEAMARKRDSLPWLLISNGSLVYEGPLPGSVDELILKLDSAQ